MLLLNELLKIELVGDLALREHVDLLLQKMTADDDDDDDDYVVHFGQCSNMVVFPWIVSRHVIMVVKVISVSVFTVNIVSSWSCRS